MNLPLMYQQTIVRTCTYHERERKRKREREREREREKEREREREIEREREREYLHKTITWKICKNKLIHCN